MNALCWLVTALSVLRAEAPPSPPIGVVLTPLKTTLVRDEPLYLLLSLTSHADAPVALATSTLIGSWEHRRADGSWEPCHWRGMADELRPSEVRVRAALNLPPGQTTVLGVVGPGCLERRGESRFELRLHAAADCCRSSTPVTILITPGSAADARARTGGNDKTAYVDSVLAGYNFIRSDFNQLYEDPVLSLRQGNYQGLEGHELDESILEMFGFLKNFPSFPFAQSIRLRLATELAVVGRRSEALMQLRQITRTVQEPHVAEDARRLEAAIHDAKDKTPQSGPAAPAKDNPSRSSPGQ